MGSNRKVNRSFVIHSDNWKIIRGVFKTEQEIGKLLLPLLDNYLLSDKRCEMIGDTVNQKLASLILLERNSGD